MDGPQKLFENALAALNSGDFSAAESLFRNVLQAQPQHIGALNLLTIVLMQMGRYGEAEDFIRRAVEHNPGSDVSFYNYGVILQNTGKHDEAAQQFTKAISLNPESYETWNSRGAAFLALGDFESAVTDFNQAIRRAPRHADLYFNKANACSQLRRHGDALSAFDEGLGLNAAAAAAWNDRGVALSELKRFDEALASYEKAISIDPRFAQAHNNRGLALVALKRHGEALLSFDAAILMKPDFADAYRNKGDTLTRSNPAEAIRCFLRAREYGANAELMDYQLSALGFGAPSAQAPDLYVTALFDKYADRFEDHLINALSYDVPGKLMKQFALNCSDHDLDVLDLGCGTGLCGQQVSARARGLVGVDLSAKMLEEAARKNLYTQLVQDNVVTFLSTPGSAYDLVFAADLFIYIGNLEGVFSNLKNVLRPGGWISFSTEAAGDGDFALDITKRYKHSDQYLKSLAQTHGLSIISMEADILRTQDGCDVEGRLVLMRYDHMK